MADSLTVGDMAPGCDSLRALSATYLSVSRYLLLTILTDKHL